MKVIQNVLRRIQCVLPECWQKKMRMVDICPSPDLRPMVDSFSTPWFPPIQFTERPNGVPHGDPLLALDERLGSSPRYSKKTIYEAAGFELSPNLSQAHLALTVVK